MPRWFAPSPERIQTIIDEIRIGSEPKTSFYVLLVAAAMIACFGLVSNSTAVVIGAMLVSPLMTPIFGICLSMLRGEAAFFGRALWAEVGGVVLAIGASYIFGLLPLTGEATPEMLSRTQPQLLDLLVAVFAGFAGAYALLDERVSPALPGVAIATAIVPPLSTCGLCLAVGAYKGAFGAFLLFFANFVAILLVASILFSIAELAPVPKWRSISDLFRRFGLSLVAFVVMAGVLTHSLNRIVAERRTAAGIKDVLSSELGGESIALDDFQHHRQDGTVYVLATVRSPDVLKPHRVTRIRDSLQEVLGSPTELAVRTMFSQDVFAIGSEVDVTKTNLNGVFFGATLHPNEANRRRAYQLVLEQLQAKPEFELLDVQYGHIADEPLVVASVRALRRFRRDEIGVIETCLQTRLKEPRLRLMARTTKSDLTASTGPVLIEWCESEDVSWEDRPLLLKLRDDIREEVAKLDRVFPTDVHFHVEDQLVRVLVTVVGPRPVTPEEVVRVQTAVSDLSQRPLELNIWYKADTVVTPQGYESYDDFTSETFDTRIKSLPRIFAAFAER